MSETGNNDHDTCRHLVQNIEYRLIKVIVPLFKRVCDTMIELQNDKSKQLKQWDCDLKTYPEFRINLCAILAYLSLFYYHVQKLNNTVSAICVALERNGLNRESCVDIYSHLAIQLNDNDEDLIKKALTLSEDDIEKIYQNPSMAPNGSKYLSYFYGMIQHHCKGGALGRYEVLGRLKETLNIV